jgi:V8-like Glu-specific endopeptidase
VLKRRHGFLFLPLLLAACGNTSEMEPSDLSLRSATSEVIVGTVDWQSTTAITGTAAVRAQAVGYLSIPAVSSRCTAWLISNELIITNNHCVANASQASGVRASFNYVDGVSWSSRVWYDCSTFVKTWPSYDMTVLRCSALGGMLPGQVHGHLTLSRWEARNNESVYVVHQNCDYYLSPGCEPTRKYSPGRVLNANYSSTDFTYDADTLGGSSGSPVLYNYNHEVVALHHNGYNGDANGRGSFNSGVKAKYVRAALGELGFYCGDNLCESAVGENASSCPSDCVYICGDGSCDMHKGEGPFNCLQDCDYCGSGTCGAYEGYYTCPEDCPFCHGRCSDGSCCMQGESCSDGGSCMLQ